MKKLFLLFLMLVSPLFSANDDYKAFLQERKSEITEMLTEILKDLEDYYSDLQQEQDAKEMMNEYVAHPLTQQFYQRKMEKIFSYMITKKISFEDACSIIDYDDQELQELEKELHRLEYDIVNKYRDGHAEELYYDFSDAPYFILPKILNNLLEKIDAALQ